MVQERNDFYNTCTGQFYEELIYIFVVSNQAREFAI